MRNLIRLSGHQIVLDHGCLSCSCRTNEQHWLPPLQMDVQKESQSGGVKGRNVDFIENCLFALDVGLKSG